MLEALEEFSKIFNKTMEFLEAEQEKFWNSLSKEDQLKVFCAVVRRIHKAELLEDQTYRGVLYGTFGFGPEAYAQAQCAGYLELHNSIVEKQNV